MEELCDDLSSDPCLWWTDPLSSFGDTNQNTAVGFENFEKESVSPSNITSCELKSPLKRKTGISKEINKRFMEQKANINKYESKGKTSNTVNTEEESKLKLDNTVIEKVTKKGKGKKGIGQLRSRFGCEECKNKRIKCDEGKPLCSRCRRRGIQCKYKILLQFREDYENKGKKFGREGVWRKEELFQKTVKELVSNSKDSHYLKIRNPNDLAFINFTVKDIIQGKRLIPHSIQLSLVPVDVRNNVDDDLIGFALNCYIDLISPIFNPTGFKGFSQQYNINIASRKVFFEPGLNLNWLIQYSQENNGIFYLVLALGFIYLAKNGSGLLGIKDSQCKCRTSSQVFKQKGMLMIGEAILLFRTNPKAKPNFRLSTDLLLSLVLLMLYEIADNCDKKWGSYLKICKDVVSSEHFEQPKNDMESYLLQFALEILNYQETMSRTACKDKNSFFLLYGGDDEKEQALNLYCPKPSSVRISWMGCDMNLVSIISDITDLSFERFNNICLENYMLLSNELKNRLITMGLGIDIADFLLETSLADSSNISSFDNYNMDGIYIDPTVDVEDFCFLLACEAKRLSGLIYLECSLLNGKPEDRYIQTLVVKAYKILAFIIIQNDFKWISTLVWSLFVISAEISVHNSECETLRYLTLKMLDRLQPRSLGNVGMIREIILGIWKNRDFKNCDENSFGYLKNQDATNINSKFSILGSRNDWETFVADESYKVSLA